MSALSENFRKIRREQIVIPAESGSTAILPVQLDAKFAALAGGLGKLDKQVKRLAWPVLRANFSPIMHMIRMSMIIRTTAWAAWQALIQMQAQDHAVAALLENITMTALGKLLSTQGLQAVRLAALACTKISKGRLAA